MWYDLNLGKEIVGNSSRVKMDAPMDQINVYVRGGSILPLTTASLTTTERYYFLSLRLFVVVHVALSDLHKS